MKTITTKFTLVLVLIVIVDICFEYPASLIRALFFFASLFLALNAWCYFEHAVLFREKWKTAISGKRRTPPGQSILIGSIFLAAASILMYFCFHR